MSINLKALEQACAAVEEIGSGETTFDVGGTPVSLRILLPTEETAVQEWASAELPSEDDSEKEAASGVFKFLDRFKLGTLSFAICQLGEMDLRDISFVETGEKLPNDAAIKIPRNEAVRGLVSKWSSTIRDGVFKKYGELLEEVGARAEAAIKFKPSDFDGEIDRLQTRIRELQAQAESDKETGFAEQVKAINEMGDEEPTAEEPTAEAAVAEAPPAPEAAPEPAQAAPEPAPAAPAPRRSSVPQQAAPPAAAPARPQAQPSPAKVAPKRHVPDESIVGPDDMEAAVEAENRRLLEARMGGQRAPVEPSGSALDALRVARRRPPHAQAQDVAQEVEGMEPDRVVDEVPVFRIDDRPEEVAAPPQQAGGAAINPPPQGKKNPRFRPPKP